jgi:hypothetical protein
MEGRGGGEAKGVADSPKTHYINPLPQNEPAGAEQGREGDRLQVLDGVQPAATSEHLREQLKILEAVLRISFGRILRENKSTYCFYMLLNLNTSVMRVRISVLILE